MGEALNVDEQVLPQGGEDALSRPLEDDGLEVGADQGDDEDARVQQDPAAQRSQLEVVLDHLLDGAHDQRRGQIVGDGDQHDAQHQDKLLLIGHRVLEEAADELPVLHVAVEAQGLLLVFDPEVGGHKDGGKHADDRRDDQDRQILTHYEVLPPPLISEGPPCAGTPCSFHRARRGGPWR